MMDGMDHQVLELEAFGLLTIELLSLIGRRVRADDGSEALWGVLTRAAVAGDADRDSGRAVAVILDDDVERSVIIGERGLVDVEWDVHGDVDALVIRDRKGERRVLFELVP
jgi:hypothetical protein